VSLNNRQKSNYVYINLSPVISVTLFCPKSTSYTEPNEAVAGPGIKRRTLISVRTLQSDRRFCHLGCFPYIYVTDGAVLYAVLPRMERCAPKQMRYLQFCILHCTRCSFIVLYEIKNDYPLYFSMFTPYQNPF
jgi:hypothetical protein